MKSTAAIGVAGILRGAAARSGPPFAEAAIREEAALDDDRLGSHAALGAATVPPTPSLGMKPALGNGPAVCGKATHASRN